MKKLVVLMLVLGMMNVASASLVSIVPIAPGAPGSATNPLHPSDFITIQVTTDAALISLDSVLTVVGPGTITDGLKIATSASYGWDSTTSSDPIIAAKEAEIGAADFALAGPGVVGYYVLHCDGAGTVTVTLAPGYVTVGGSFDDGYNEPTVAGSLDIYQTPEPMTLSLLGLGGLFLRRRK
jgi:hypothetical protein